MSLGGYTKNTLIGKLSGVKYDSKTRIQTMIQILHNFKRLFHLFLDILSSKDAEGELNEPDKLF